MKNKTPRVTLLGNNSGRNLGDAAILSSIMEHLSNEIPNVEFYVPTIAPQWIEKHYGSKYRVHPVNVMPWTLSVRLLGLPTLLCLAKSDVALICDGIIFGKKLLNPAFNYLITLFFLVPLAKLLKCKVACFNCGIGPFPSRLSRWMARYVINSCDLVTMREKDSKHLAEEIGVTRPISLTGDSAFINPVSSRERGCELLRKVGANYDSAALLGVNVTAYLDTWLTKKERMASGSDLIKIIADGVNTAKKTIEKESGEVVQPIIFCTQPMDEGVSKRLSELTDASLVDNTNFLSHDIQAAMRECRLFVGMRFHSLILASAVDVPIIGLIYAPKVRGYMKLLNCEHLGLELATLSEKSLSEQIVSAWADRRALLLRQQQVISTLRQGAMQATSLLKTECLNMDSSVTIEAVG